MNKRFLAVILVYLWTLSVWAFPEYDIGNIYKGLSRDNDSLASPICYVESKSTEEIVLEKAIEYRRKSAGDKVLRQSSDPHTLRYTNSDGSVTYWKSTDLNATVTEDSSTDYWGRGESQEYGVMPITRTDEGLLLFDKSENQYVSKFNNGTAYYIPKNLSDYTLELNVQYKLGPIPTQWVFAKYESGIDFRMAVTNYKGDVSLDLILNQPVSLVNYIYYSVPAERYLVDYNDAQGKRGLLILSDQGTVIKNYSRFNPGNVITFYPFAERYVTTWGGFPYRHVIDLMDGEIKAALTIEHIDLAFVNDSLLAVVSTAKRIGIVDVLNGILIQDFSDYNRVHNIEWVHFQKKGKEFVIGDNSKDSKVTRKRFILENSGS